MNKQLLFGKVTKADRKKISVEEIVEKVREVRFKVYNEEYET